MTDNLRFQEIHDIENVIIWARDKDGGLMRAATMDGNYVAELNGDMLVIEEQEENAN